MLKLIFHVPDDHVSTQLAQLFFHPVIAAQDVVSIVDHRFAVNHQARKHQAGPGPDFVSLAKAHGVAACRVETAEGVEPAIRLAMAHEGPFLVEFMVEPEENVFPMVPPGAGLGEMMLE